MERGIGRLLLRSSLPGGLAELVQAALDVEDVVDDLEGQAERLARRG